MGTLGVVPAFIFFSFALVFAVASAESPALDASQDRPPPSCTSVCPKNEEPRCRNPCPPETCMALYAAFRCIENQTCVQGCYCKKGFLRTTTNGTCVPRDQCNPLECVNDPNAKRGCGNRCGKTCADFKDRSKVCDKGPCKKNGCDCKDGFVYDANLEICVKPKDCTKQCTKPHEKYSNCLLGECVPKTCADLGKSLPCPDIAPPCAGGCMCEEGYVRDVKGNCVEVKKCPSCGGDPNAQSGCGNPCGKTCASINSNKTDLVCPQYCEVNGCDCKDGYALNTDTKKCVLIKDCPKPVDQCGKNEQFFCGPSCPEASCDNPNPPICINKRCQLKCFCKKGFVRDANKKCIPADKCVVKCNKPNERYIDCLAGQCLPKTCDDLGKSLPCPSIRGPCPGGCICNEGYLRNSEGTCVKIEKCPPKPCGANQTWVSPCNAPCPNNFCPVNDQAPAPCAPIQPCYPGCQCKLNYRFNATRSCILAPDCPPVKCTRQNEVWDSCPSACLAENCEDINNQPKVCNTLIWLCSPRCICAKGHFRNKDGLCVPAAQCPATCTKPNEKYIDCLAGQCNPKTCDELVNPAPCPRVRPPCPGGCICVDGFVRNSAGDCIKEENCPKTCNGPNELYTDCVQGQCKPTTCKEVVQMPVCPAKAPTSCTPGCICKSGFVRSDNGTCVAIKDCPQAGTCTAKNETWVECAANCGPAYCPKDDKPQNICFLPAFCPPGCHCKPNYRVNKNNKCILASECPPVKCTRPNEEFSSCPPDSITACAQIGTTPLPNDGPKICNPGCVCKSGFYKNDSNICVPEKDCPGCGGDPNAQSGCGNPCLSGGTCANKGKPPGACPQYCKEGGCDCKSGYLLDTDTNKCIPEGECPKNTTGCGGDPNAQSGCGNPCGKTCDSKGKPPTPCPLYCRADGCDCIPGYLLDTDINKCVPEGECPKNATGCGGDPNAQSGCGNPCGKTCDSKGKPPTPCPLYCKTDGCDCKPGYLLDTDINKCVPEGECPKNTTGCGGDPNAQSGCGNLCGKTCANKGKPPVPCARYCKVGGCDCKRGYLLDTDTNKCVPEGQCPKPQQCTKPHERYSDCLLGECVPKVCEDLGKPLACPAIAGPCGGGCICERGYVRDSKGNCIEAKNCPSCGGDPNAVTGCGNNCGNTCETYNNKTGLVCPLYCNTNGCDCKDGYVYNTATNKCTLIKDCPSPTTCNKPYETYINCYSGQCTPKTCAQLGEPIACPFIAGRCEGGCICEQGYLRNTEGNCIKIEQCPAKPCGANQTWASPCDSPCPSPLCPRNDDPAPLCMPPKPCFPECLCKPNYSLNGTRDCILTADCPPAICTRQNEVLDPCPSPCLAENCGDLNIESDSCSSTANTCTPKCVCAKGYLRNQEGLCVPAAECPNLQCTKPHERYTNCLLGECIPKTCDDLGKPIPCASIASPCAGGCICEEGFVRINSNGDCIDKLTCPSCGEDPNAQSGCGNPCGKTCASLNANKSSLICPLDCEYNGCDCKPGFLLNTDTKKCVKEEDCPNQGCKGDLNAVPGCAGYCGQICNKPVKNPRLECEHACIPGCKCKPGFFYNEDIGKCVTQEECPKPQPTCNANQTYVSCNIKCPDKYCPGNDQPLPVCAPPLNCPPGCSCKINYRLNKTGDCILASECPAINCTRQNEEYNSCPSDCLTENCEDADTPPAVCNTLLLNCQPKCVCKKGHFRNKDGLCVPARECPSVCKDPNAEWKDCRDACPGTCQNTKPVCLSKTCIAGCQCKNGYVLSKTGGECVEIEKCADYVNCGANQTFVSCTFKCPQVMCPRSDQTILCKPPRDCPGGCGCKPNYRYNAAGECILGSDCPPVKCTRPNEEWAPCRSEYDWERCEDRYNSPPIVPDNGGCNPRCVCIKGHYRDSSNKCVPECQCPPIIS